jgi:ubiquinone/menaquinone biosynthesis C-methylase UbiE
MSGEMAAMGAGFVPSHAGMAFDALAERYDEIFTRTLVGRLQRQTVWEALDGAFHAGQTILELNCGTGEDALFLAGRGMRVLACDAAPRMIAVAWERKARELPGADVQFQVLPSERLASLQPEKPFDGVLSNFSGLNCVGELRGVAAELGRLVRSGGRALLCLSTRVCLWEMAWYLAHGKPRKALRRLGGESLARVEGVEVEVHYPTVGAVRRAFAPEFCLRRLRAVGLLVPPSYAEGWASQHRTTLNVLEKLDRSLGALPILCRLGDHVLFDFERSAA